MKKRDHIFTFSIVISLLFGFAFPLFAQEGTGKPSNKAVNQKIGKLQIPFIANEGQADKKVAFYANTFGGTVFVTNEGEIVYALPKALGVESLESGVMESEKCRGELRTPDQIQQRRGELHSPNVIHNTGCEVHDNHKSCIKDNKSFNNSQTHNSKLVNFELQGVALKETLVGAKVKEIKGEDKSATKINYFKGNDQKKWKSNISTYDVVDLGEVYNGIELKLKAYGNNVEKLFHVKPGANPDQIKINLSGIQPPGNPPPLSPSVRGTGVCPPLAGVGGGLSGGLSASGLWVNEQGQLVAETALGPVTFTKPVAYQEIDGKRVNVEVEYSIENTADRNQNINCSTKNASTLQLINSELTYGFAVASYDKTKELIIDPLLASTFLGGSDHDYVESLALGINGNVYVAGVTQSNDFPTTTGAFNTSFNAVFVSKFDSELTSLQVSTILSGSDDEDDYESLSILVDKSGNVYVTGDTSAIDFPVTIGAYDSTFGGETDVFVSKLDSDLTKLLASTYLGGNDYDYNDSIALDESGNVYVTGQTYSITYPTTTSAYNTFLNGERDAFISKLDSELTKLLASTYLGGNSDDIGRSLALDTSGNVYITGYTSSSDFPTTIGAYDRTSDSIFISKLDSELMKLLASTYLGGDDSDSVKSLALDTSGNVYIAGYTSSDGFPTTKGAYDITLDGYYDAFISKLDSELTNLLASTYLGGTHHWDEVFSLTIDTSDNVYVTGYTSSKDFPITADAYDTTFNGGYYDAFVSKLDSGLTKLLASMYIGGEDDDYGNCLALDTSGNVYVTGYTSSLDFPTTTGAFDITFGGEWDVFTLKIDSNLSSTSTEPPTTSLTGKIFGYVVDENNTSIESAKVRCKGKSSNYKEVIKTDKEGYFEFNNLDADSYKINAAKKGYYKSKYNVNLDEAEEKEIEIVLEEK